MSNKNFTILFTILTIVLGVISLIFGLDRTFHLWNIPTMNPIFSDIRSISGVNETLAQGLDPLVINPGDPWNRAMNYPRVWQYIADHLNLNQDTAIYFGFINIILFVVGFLMFVSRIELSKLTASVLLLAFFSPVSILALERGNIDMMMFFLLSVALVYISRPIIFSSMILTASFLKIFPVFALSGLLKQQKSIFLKFFSLSALIFLAYIVIILDDIMLIKKANPQSLSLSYGINVFPISFKRFFESNNVKAFIQIGSYLYVLIMASSILFYLTHNYSVFLRKINTKYIDAFRVGSAIYLMTFLFARNYDYRLIFLIFTLPQLILWNKSKIKTIKILASLAIINILIAMWFLVISRYLGGIPWYVGYGFKFVFFSCLLPLFIISLPNWIFKLFQLRTNTKIIP